MMTFLSQQHLDRQQRYVIINFVTVFYIINLKFMNSVKSYIFVKFSVNLYHEMYTQIYTKNISDFNFRIFGCVKYSLLAMTDLRQLALLSANYPLSELLHSNILKFGVLNGLPYF